ncbi:hypothetical protein CYLTODRAFT_459844 [Cylindrobasidium torrendii FP15055 ss-10]|uniref:Uncharacterized protein n=1 Tax=Cylindrobasidium torrendii FP15055 ss-10 TaxID=1314674 RepID=A0A0D7ASW8_9AGAR|nr:hypothetical protein CYLTODRAFT_459844 [Cylindrobasidium torrendii FP15055 ss-10]
MSGKALCFDSTVLNNLYPAELTFFAARDDPMSLLTLDGCRCERQHQNATATHILDNLKKCYGARSYQKTEVLETFPLPQASSAPDPGLASESNSSHPDHIGEPMQEEPMQEEPAQEWPVQEEPMQEWPVQEWPVQEEPMQEWPVQEGPAEEPEPMQETESEKLPEVACKPFSMNPYPRINIEAPKTPNNNGLSPRSFDAMDVDSVAHGASPSGSREVFQAVVGDATDLSGEQESRRVGGMVLRSRPDNGPVYAATGEYDTSSDMTDSKGTGDNLTHGNDGGATDDEDLAISGETDGEDMAISGETDNSTTDKFGNDNGTGKAVMDTELCTQIALEYDEGLDGFFCTRSRRGKPRTPCGRLFFTVEIAATHIQKHHGHKLKQSQRRRLTILFGGLKPHHKLKQPSDLIRAYKRLPILEGWKCPQCTFGADTEKAVHKHLSTTHKLSNSAKKRTLSPAFFQTIHRISFCVHPQHSKDIEKKEAARVAEALREMDEECDLIRESQFQGKSVDSSQSVARNYLWIEYTAGKDPELLGEQLGGGSLIPSEEDVETMDDEMDDDEDDVDEGQIVLSRPEARRLRNLVTKYLIDSQTCIGNLPEEMQRVLSKGGDSRLLSSFQEESTARTYAGLVYQLIRYCHWKPPDGKWTASYLKPSLTNGVATSLRAVLDAVKQEDAESIVFEKFDQLFRTLWQQYWPPSTSTTFPDPTLSFLALKHLKDDGTFAVDRVGNNTHYLLYFMRASFIRRYSPQGQLDIAEFTANSHWITHLGEFSPSCTSTYATVYGMRTLAGQTFRKRLAVPNVNTDSLANDGVLLYKDNRSFDLAAFKNMICDLEQRIMAAWVNLLHGLYVEVDFTSHSGVCDVLTDTTNQYSFIYDHRNQHLREPGHQLLDYLIQLPGWTIDRLPVPEVWETNFLQPLAAIEQDLALHAQYGSGSPWRGTELVSLLFGNTPARGRNIRFMDPYLVSTSEYSKTSSIMHKDQFIPKALPAFTSRMLLQVHAIARPIVIWYLSKHKSTHRFMNEPITNLYNTMAFMDYMKPLASAKVSASMQLLAQPYLGWPMDLSSYRHIQTALHQELCTKTSAHTQSALRAALNAAKGKVKENQLFSRSDEELGGSEEVIMAYIEVSKSWQEVLGLQESGRDGVECIDAGSDGGYDSDWNDMPDQLRCARLKKGAN